MKHVGDIRSELVRTTVVTSDYGNMADDRSGRYRFGCAAIRTEFGPPTRGDSSAGNSHQRVQALRGRGCLGTDTERTADIDDWLRALGYR